MDSRPDFRDLTQAASRPYAYMLCMYLTNCQDTNLPNRFWVDLTLPHLIKQTVNLTTKIFGTLLICLSNYFGSIEDWYPCFRLRLVQFLIFLIPFISFISIIFITFIISLFFMGPGPFFNGPWALF